jgi:uncharacterized protein with PIN domain
MSQTKKCPECGGQMRLVSQEEPDPSVPKPVIDTKAFVCDCGYTQEG